MNYLLNFYLINCGHSNHSFTLINASVSGTLQIKICFQIKQGKRTVPLPLIKQGKRTVPLPFIIF